MNIPQIDNKLQIEAAFMQNNPAPVMQVSLDGYVKVLNPAALEIFGKEAPKESIFILLPGLDKSIFRDIGSEKLTQYQITVGNRSFLFTIRKDEKTDSLYFFGADITEYKQADKKLQASENKLRTLYESSSDAIMLLGEKGFINCNAATLKIFGCASSEEFCSKHPADLSPPTQPCGTDSITLAMEQIAIADKNGSNRFEGVHKRLDGNSFSAEVLLTAICLDEKNVILATVRDITERKRAEENQKNLTELLINSNDKLEDALINRELAEEVLSEKSIELEDRVKELTCMYKIADVVERCECLEQIFHNVVKPIPSAWKYPEITRAKIHIYGQEYVSKAFEKTEWKLTSDIIVSGEVKGCLEVYYLKKCPNQYEGPFTQDECNLINNITQALGKAVEREKIKETNLILFKISEAAFSTKNLEEMLKIIYPNLGLLINTSNFYVALYDNKTELYSFPFHVDEYDSDTDLKSLDLRKSLTDYVRRTASPLLINKKDYQRLADSGEVGILGTPAEVWLGAPLTLGDNIIGTVAVQSYSDPNAYTRNDLDILTFVSEHIAIAIERKRAEDILSQTISRYTAMINTVPALMYIKDIDHKYIEVNEAFCRLVNKSKDEIIGKNCFEVHSEELAKKYYADDNSVMENDTEIINQEEKYIENIGEIRWISSSKIPLHDSNGKVSGLVGLAQDITEQYIGRQQLIQSDKLAGIGQLAAGVAHEINNPVGYINSNLNTMGKYLKKVNEFIEGQDKSTSEDLENIKEMLKDFTDAINESMEGTNRVKQLVSDLKSFSRVDRAEKEHTDINEGINTTLNVVRNEIKYKAEVKKELGEIPELYCMPNQLNQVFMNLLVNSAHAIEKENGLITIKTWADDGNIYISIADDGVGIPEKNIKKLFEPFFTTKDVGKGTGLGLSLSYDIIKKHKGFINVRSEVGVGTEFTITLPLEGIDERKTESVTC